MFHEIRKWGRHWTGWFDCPFCCGLWFVTAALLVMRRWPAGRPLVWWLAALGVHTLVEQASHRLDAY